MMMIPMMPYELYFKANKVTRYRNGYYVLTKELMYQVDLM